jgi:hypothetical protein
MTIVTSDIAVSFDVKDDTRGGSPAGSLGNYSNARRVRLATDTSDAATLQKSFEGAAKKMARQLESTLGKLHYHKGEASIGTEIGSE